MENIPRCPRKRTEEKRAGYQMHSADIAQATKIAGGT